ncbi:MAG: hypothetical protein WBD22_05855 [Pyrinomonadaceae bacterium]
MKSLNILGPALLVLAVFTSVSFGQKMTADDVLARHIQSLGRSEVRKSLKSIITVGDAEITFVSPKNRPVNGRLVMASAAEKMFFGMNLNAADYQSEKFSFNGTSAKVDYIRPGSRSVLGNFIQSNPMLLEESLLGGTLSTSWSLVNNRSKGVKLSYDGKKKVDGRDTHILLYTAKGDLSVSLYFDAETFHHVRTEYKRTSSAGIGLNPEDSTRFSESRLKMVEDFSDFRAEHGLMLPHLYKLSYTVTGQRGTTDIQWNFTMNEFAFNQNLDPRSFELEETK